MMPSNFPISRAPKGCSFLQLAQERRRRTLHPTRAPRPRPQPRGESWGRAALSEQHRHTKTSRPRQPPAERHQSGESGTPNSIPADRPGLLPAGAEGSEGSLFSFPSSTAMVPHPLPRLGHGCPAGQDWGLPLGAPGPRTRPSPPGGGGPATTKVIFLCRTPQNKPNTQGEQWQQFKRR